MEGLLRKFTHLLNIGRSHEIARRYFVVNGFDGALTMLGLLIGFELSGEEDVNTILTACTGAAIALFVSGMSSAYLSESAERQKTFQELQDAMLSDLENSAHETVTRWAPVVVAFVNGLAPLFFAIIILTPFWLTRFDIVIGMRGIPVAIAIAFSLIFLLGVFLGRVSGRFWLISGIQALLIATITGALIFLVA